LSFAAARIWGIVGELAAAGPVVLADKGFHGTGDPIRTPCKGRKKPESQKAANRAHAKLRGPGERANAVLKSWRILRKLRSCPRPAGQLAKAIHVLQAHESEGEKRLMDAYRLSGLDDFASMQVLRTGTMPDGSEVAPMRMAEARLTLAAAAARQDDLEQPRSTRHGG
jgi:hypothetical protein